ncbi:MAG: tetratricopeptide repeat protein [Acidobacteria bacterium]|nr:tetratricopeptide repeat protein [Acidobacteriota bacterium]
MTALAVRLVHVWQMRATPFFSVLLGDSRGYDEWARRIAAGEWIGHDVFYQAPLYPYMLGVIYAIAGRHLLLVRVVQALIGSASCVFLALAAERLVSRRAGIAAGLMLALYAPAIFFDGLIQKSVLDVFFLCIGLYLIARITVRLKPDTTETPRFDPGSVRRQPDRGDSGNVRLQPDRHALWFLLGLTMGALALTRENALVFILVIVAWALVAGPRSQIPPNPQSPIPNPLARRAKRAAAFAGGLAVLLLPVAARNAYVAGGFYITTSQAGPNFYIGNNANADGTYQSLRFGRGAPEYERQDATELAERGLGRTLTPAEVSSYWIDKALDFITSEPGAWLKLTARKTALLWNATEVLDTESQETHAEYSWPLKVLGIVGHFGVLVPLALLGVVFTWPLRRRLAIVYALTLAYAASVVAFYVFARYRYPLVPMLMIFAAAGMVDARVWLTAHATDRGNAFGLAGAAVATIVFCNWPLLSATTMRAVTENNLATALQTDGRLDEAVAHYQRAIALQPDYAPAYNNLGTALRAKGKPLDAVAEYQRRRPAEGRGGSLPHRPAGDARLRRRPQQPGDRVGRRGQAGRCDHRISRRCCRRPGVAEIAPQPRRRARRCRTDRRSADRVPPRRAARARRRRRSLRPGQLPVGDGSHRRGDRRVPRRAESVAAIGRSPQQSRHRAGDARADGRRHHPLAGRPRHRSRLRRREKKSRDRTARPAPRAASLTPSHTARRAASLTPSHTKLMVFFTW